MADPDLVIDADASYAVISQVTAATSFTFSIPFFDDAEIEVSLDGIIKDNPSEWTFQSRVDAEQGGYLGATLTLTTFTGVLQVRRKNPGYNNLNIIQSGIYDVNSVNKAMAQCLTQMAHMRVPHYDAVAIRNFDLNSSPADVLYNSNGIHLQANAGGLTLTNGSGVANMVYQEVYASNDTTLAKLQGALAIDASAALFCKKQAGTSVPSYHELSAYWDDGTYAYNLMMRGWVTDNLSGNEKLHTRLEIHRQTL